MNTNMNNTQINAPMQRKTIEKICKGKIYDWAKSVEKDSPETAEIIKTQTMITGGALVSLLSGEPVNDFDCYFRSKDAAFKVATYYVNKFKDNNSKWINSKVSEFQIVDDGDRVRVVIKSQGVVAKDEAGSAEINESPDESITTDSPTEQQYQYFEQTRGNEAETFLQSLVDRRNKENANYEPVFISDNAITLSNQIQLVIRFFGEPEEIHKHFDFQHVLNVYTIWDDTLHLSLDALECIRTKTLKYQNSLYPVCSLFRLRKFISRGFKISAGQIFKIVWAIKELNLNDPDVLKEQLMGCDSYYFIELLDILNRDTQEGKTIDQTYIANLVDIVFDF